jgi:hypothetical protein
MVNLAHIQGQMRASSIARITQLADEHPDEALGVIRRWLAPEEAGMSETRIIPGPQKAAVLMLALGEDHASRMFARMHEDEIRDVSAAMAQLGTISAATVEEICDDFAVQLGRTGGSSAPMRAPSACCSRRCRATAWPRSWRRSAARPGAPCGTSSAT